MLRGDEIREQDGHLVRELHGVNLTHIVEYLVHHLGFEQLGAQIPLNCFLNNPSVKSSLVFLRRTPWAREKIEQLYVDIRSDEIVFRAAKASEEVKTE